jgi:hypothetical protein
VRVELRNWTLKPYLACHGAPQCGFVLLTVTDPDTDPPLQISAAATSIPVELGRLTSPEGLLKFRVELRDEEGKAADNGPFADEVTVQVSARCGETFPSDASVPDATADAASEAGQPDGATGQADGATPDAAAADAADASSMDAPAETGAPSDAMDAPILDAAID